MQAEKQKESAIQLLYFDGPLCTPVRIEQESQEENWWSDYWLDPLIRRKYFNLRTAELKDPTKWHHERLWDNGKIVVPVGRETEVIAKYHDSPAA